MQRVSWFLRISGLTLLALIVAIAGLTTGSADAQSATQAATTVATAAAQPARPIELCYTTDQVSEVRVVHAAAGAPGVDIYLNNAKTPAISGLAYGKSADYMQVLAGTYQYKVTAAGNASKIVASGSVTLKGQNAYTLLAAGSPVKVTPLLDNASDTAGMARLNFVHAVAGGPAIDVITTSDKKAVISKLAEGAEATVDLAPNTYNLAVIKNGDAKATSLIDLTGVVPKLAADTITTVVLTGAMDKTGKVTNQLATIILSSTSFAGYPNPNPPPAPPTPTNTPAPTATKGPAPTSTPKPTATPKPTSTPKPTAGPKPTATPIPPTATPIPVGQSPASLGEALRSSRAGYFYLNGGKCVEVAGSTIAGGPGDVAGLKTGDLILGVDGVGIATAADFQTIIASHASGDKVTVTIERDGKRQDIKVTLGANPFLGS